MELDILDFVALIGGAVLPFVVALVRRIFKVELTPSMTNWIVVAVSVVMAVVARLSQNNTEIAEMLEEAMVIYGLSQVVYKGINKPTGLNKIIEGK